MELDTSRSSTLHLDSFFFDSLVESIPLHVYFPANQTTQAWKHAHQGSSAKAAAKQAAKERSKKAKRAKLDPATAHTTLDVIRQSRQPDDIAEDGSEQAQAEGDTSTARDGHGDGGHHLLQGTGRARSHEELRERLQQRLAALRQQRHAKVASEAASNAREWRQQQQNSSVKERSGSKRKALADPPSPALPAAEEATLDLEFSRVQTAPSNSTRHSGPRPRKEKILKKVEDASKAGEADDKQFVGDVGQTKSWGAALGRAAGQKVLDDPKLLRRTLKRQEKSKEKSTKKWVERKDRERKAVKVKQQRRTDHLQQRIQTKKDNKIAKREKKLMRPGFEGRKAGFLNDKGSSEA